MDHRHNSRWENKVMKLAAKGCTYLNQGDFAFIRRDTEAIDMEAFNGRLDELYEMCEKTLKALQSRHAVLEHVKVLLAVFLPYKDAVSEEEMTRLPSVFFELDEVSFCWSVVIDSELSPQSAAIATWIGYGYAKEEEAE